jgi:catechol 2,3-dioxygenase-like lactoylglutathione lyase family enzyme
LEISMYDHIGLKVANLDASVRDGSGAGFGPKGEPALWLYLDQAASGAGAHIAFRAPGHDAIRKFHAAGLKAGGRDNGAAGPRADYSASYFAAFLIDPDGNNVEAVCT